jgi:integrase/recombinase XerD
VILAAQTRLRDRFLFALLAGTGMRIGQALGLRHSDVVSHERRIEIIAREDNANGARGKRGHGWVPITGELVRLHSDYMHAEYGDLDSDYVFVNLRGGRVGHAMSYDSVDEVVRRTRRRVGFHFTPHQLRHTYATVARRGGVPVEIVSKLLCHRSVRRRATPTCTPRQRICASSSSAPACCSGWERANRRRSNGCATAPAACAAHDP